MRLVTQPWRRVPAGTNGGVSFVGSLAALLGGLSLGVAFALADALGDGGISSGGSSATTTALERVLFGAALCTCAALLGTTLDSLLGATLQLSLWDDTLRRIVSRASASTKHVSGVDVLNNHQVGFGFRVERWSNARCLKTQTGELSQRTVDCIGDADAGVIAGAAVWSRRNAIHQLNAAFCLLGSVFFLLRHALRQRELRARQLCQIRDHEQILHAVVKEPAGRWRVTKLDTHRPHADAQTPSDAPIKRRRIERGHRLNGLEQRRAELDVAFDLAVLRLTQSA